MSEIHIDKYDITLERDTGEACMIPHSSVNATTNVPLFFTVMSEGMQNQPVYIDEGMNDFCSE